MRCSPLIFSCALVGGALVAAGCSSSPMSRIDSNRGLYESWPVEVRQAILDGRVENGMTPEQVRMAVGEPNDVRYRQSRKGDEEVWIYRSGGSNPLGNTNVNVGGVIGGMGTQVGVPTGNAPSTSGAMENEVVFQNGEVVRSTFGGGP